MKNKLVITRREDIVYYGYFKEGQAVELYCERYDNPSLLGRIYVARVDKIAEGIQGAFLELSKEQKGYYPLNSAAKPVKLSPGHEDRLYNGDLILVQVTKDAVKSKLPVVDSNVSLSGSYAVISLERRGINISRKIKDAGERERLLTIAREAYDTYAREDYGLVIRTNAKGIAPERLTQELQSLFQQADLILQKARTAPARSLIAGGDIPYYIKLAQELPQAELDQILTDDPEIEGKLLGYYASDTYRSIAEKVKRYQDDYPLYLLYRFEHFYDMALSKTLPLKSGGSIVIEATEAMTVIDVNSGAAIRNKKNAQNIYEAMNREAAVEIAAQLRLRNLSGIIIIDFINMKEEESRKRIFTFLKQECERDRIPVRVIDFTALNLVEMTRNKTRKSLKEQWQECKN